MARAAKTKRSLLIVLTILLIVGAGVAALELTNTTHLFHAAKFADSASTKEKLENSATTTGQTQPGDSQDKGDNGSDNGTNAGFILREPSGNFVSNHHAYLKSKPNFNIEQSVCTTTSGATCQISFTNTLTSETKSLESRLVDAGGSAYWTWKLQDIGLTAGDWKVSATAKHGDNAKIAQDPMLLEIRE